MHQPGHLPLPRAGQAPLRGAGDRHRRGRAGRQGPDAGRYDWTIDPLAEDPDANIEDTVDPDTRIAAAPPLHSTSDAATFRFTGSDNLTLGPNLTVRVPARRRGLGSLHHPEDLHAFRTASHTFEVRAIDRRGNFDETPAVYTWTVDKPPSDIEPPNTTLEPELPDPLTVRNGWTFNFSSEDPTATFECSIDGGATWTACSSPHSVSGLAVGSHTFSVRAVDHPALNRDPTPATHSWTVGEAPVAANVFCGQKIMRSTRVMNDLTDCLWDGIVVGAPNITIDLDGHTIDGKGIGSGIRNDGHDNVTIRNGKVFEFDWGVSLNVGTQRTIVEGLTLERNQESAIVLGNRGENDPALGLPTPPELPASFDSEVVGNTLRNNTVVANDQGIWLTNKATDNVIRGNAIAANGHQGVWLERAHDNLIEDNEIRGTSGPGVELEGSTNNSVVDNLLEENSGGGVALGVTSGLHHGIPSHDNLVERNTIEEAGGSALEVEGLEAAPLEGNQLIDNVAHRSNGEGVSVNFARNTLVRGNDVRMNKYGITVEHSRETRLEQNDASESEGTGIEVSDLSFNNVIVRNNSSHNDGTGIVVSDEAGAGTGSIIERNRTNNNKNYGIFVSKVSHEITDNAANDNGTWGIWVSEGSNGRVNIDGGGNTGQGNLGPLDPLTLKPLQCYSVRCDGTAAPSDLISPNTTIVAGPADGTRDDVATFRFAGTDNASGTVFQCRIDSTEDGDWTECQSPYSEIVTVGPHTFEVRAVDTSGNADPTPAVHTWTILAPLPFRPPITTIHTGPDATTTRTDALFEFSADERLSDFACWHDAPGASDTPVFAPCSWLGMPTLMFARGSVQYNALAVGVHQFKVRAADRDIDPTRAAQPNGSSRHLVLEGRSAARRS